jgi:hypothetical protein
MGGSMPGGGMWNVGQSGDPQKFLEAPPGSGIFWGNCALCHPNGGNVLDPGLPIKGSGKLKDYKTFLRFIRHPKMPDGSEGEMPNFPKSKISDLQAKRLYQFIIYAENSTLTGRYAMGPGFGVGPGMMDNGMGPGIIGRGYYDYSPECQQFYDETRSLRKELVEKRFEYSEVLRNPKAVGATAAKLEQEIKELRDKIYAQAPLGCNW